MEDENANTTDNPDSLLISLAQVNEPVHYKWVCNWECGVDLTQHLLRWWQTEAEAGGVHNGVVLWMDQIASILQWAQEFPETRHVLPKSLNFLLPLLLGNSGRVHFKVENSGFHWIIVSLRQKGA